MILSKEIQRIKSETADISLKMLYGKTAEEIVKEVVDKQEEIWYNQCIKRKKAIK